jgi:drug/metabolite transporter (DMT)-like permease
MRAPSRGRALALLAMAVVLFATTWPVMKLGLEGGATPIWFAAARAGLGAAAGFALLLVTGRLQRPARADLPIVVSVGLLQLASFFVLVNLGLGFVPAGRSAVLAYTTTLWLAPLAVLSGERLPAARAIGALVGLAGVAVLVNPLTLDWSDKSLLAGHFYLLLAALAWALAIFHARRHAWRSTPLQLMPWQMLTATLPLTLLALLAEPEGHAAPSLTSSLSLLYLGVFAGPVATWAATSVAQALPMFVSSIGFLGVPVLGVLMSTFWLGEALTPTLAVGSAIILAGVGLAAASAARERGGSAKEKPPPGRAGAEAARRRR